jgi:hypothetical protein
MKLRLLAVMALVVVGAMAGTSPAMAAKAKTSASKAWQNQHKDNKVFGDAINNLRKSSDSTNAALGTIAGAAQVALLQLKDGLTAVAASYGNFEYGVMQVGFCNKESSTVNTCDDFNPISAAFAATPRLDPTVEQASVTTQVAPPVATANKNIGVSVAVRSADPLGNNKKSDVYCRVTESQGGRYSTSTPTATGPGGEALPLPFYPIRRSALAPTEKSELSQFPLSMVSTDIQYKMSQYTNSAGNTGNPDGGIGGFIAVPTAAGGSMINVTLACVTVPKS